MFRINSGIFVTHMTIIIILCLTPVLPPTRRFFPTDHDPVVPFTLLAVIDMSTKNSRGSLNLGVVVQMHFVCLSWFLIFLFKELFGISVYQILVSRALKLQTIGLVEGMFLVVLHFDF